MRLKFLRVLSWILFPFYLLLVSSHDFVALIPYLFSLTQTSGSQCYYASILGFLLKQKSRIHYVPKRNGLLSSKTPQTLSPLANSPTKLLILETCGLLLYQSYYEPTVLPTFLSSTNSALVQTATRTLIDYLQSNPHSGVSFKNWYMPM